jgi:Ni,Fe-hydrogenase III small subunit
MKQTAACSRQARCARGGVGAVVVPVDLWIAGCPPTPRDLLNGLLTLLPP